MRSPKITVIIPTRERCDVLEWSLRTVTSQDYDNLEIIVSDNDSTDDTAGVVRRANDPRIRYVNTGKRLSMSHNWEFALSHVREGWVSFIGDDDGLLPESIKTVAGIIETADVDAIRSTCCTYHWPAIMGNEHGQLIVPMRSGAEIREAPFWLGKVMRGVAKYPQLPVIYDGGFINLAALHRVKSKTGAFFSSCNPDLYSAIAIASVIDRYVFLHAPTAVSGVSKHSTGNSSFSIKKNKNTAPVSTFYSERNIPFHAAVPLHEDGSLPISFQAMVYEAYLQSAALRDASPGVNHRQQLEIILATAEAHSASIEKWGRLFAEQHEINFASAKHSATFKRAYLQPLSTSRKIINAMHTVFAEDLPIRNIHEACIAAGTIRARPGKMGTMRFLGRELSQRLKWRED
ncbi:glycosyltransferase family 2 protein [Dyella psychrodurans]|uniref:Glycosyltransferase family 2 protein n=1 Tax=Dyella psychrodurans TaxID=1927960 RepID=A0A370XA31_9GAMM|nr:glycosyltransferase [Dyella psychrodurans]RDS85293.1 glycosyltransferase family 2 protein [Dyella psychrodurans]